MPVPAAASRLFWPPCRFVWAPMPKSMSFVDYFMSVLMETLPEGRFAEVLNNFDGRQLGFTHAEVVNAAAVLEEQTHS